jgi:hypothetical protein
MAGVKTLSFEIGHVGLKKNSLLRRFQKYKLTLVTICTVKRLFYNKSFMALKIDNSALTFYKHFVTGVNLYCTQCTSTVCIFYICVKRRIFYTRNDLREKKDFFIHEWSDTVQYTIPKIQRISYRALGKCC